jgi:hypothetical protein
MKSLPVCGVGFEVGLTLPHSSEQHKTQLKPHGLRRSELLARAACIRRPELLRLHIEDTGIGSTSLSSVCVRQQYRSRSSQSRWVRYSLWQNLDA